MTQFRFSKWATPVAHRGWALVTLALHRAQRLTAPPAHWGRRAREAAAVHASTTRLHRVIRRAECAAFTRATT